MSLQSVSHHSRPHLVRHTLTYGYNQPTGCLLWGGEQTSPGGVYWEGNPAQVVLCECATKSTGVLSEGAIQPSLGCLVRVQPGLEGDYWRCLLGGAIQTRRPGGLFKSKMQGAYCLPRCNPTGCLLGMPRDCILRWHNTVHGCIKGATQP